MQIATNIISLKNLQSIGIVEANDDFIRQIQSMVQLNSIGISNVKEGDERNLCVSIENMRLLRVLTIMVTNEEETLQMDALSSPPPNLRRLILTGKLEKIPQWFRSLQSLTQICICVGRDWKKMYSLASLLCPIWDILYLVMPMLENSYVSGQTFLSLQNWRFIIPLSRMR